MLQVVSQKFYKKHGLTRNSIIVHSLCFNSIFFKKIPVTPPFPRLLLYYIL